MSHHDSTRVHTAAAEPTEVPDGDPGTGPARRSVVALGATAALGLTAAASLAACGSGSSASTSSAGSANSASASDTAAASASGSSSAASGGSALAKLADVPVGGAVAASGSGGAPIIIAQPTAGKVVAFSAKCTHQGCAVAVSGTELSCPCHGSKFDALTGKVTKGPATTDLPAVSVAVSGTDIVSA